MADEGGSVRLAADVSSMLIKWNSRLGGGELIWTEKTLQLVHLPQAHSQTCRNFFSAPIVSPPPLHLHPRDWKGRPVRELIG